VVHGATGACPQMDPKLRTSRRRHYRDSQMHPQTTRVLKGRQGAAGVKFDKSSRAAAGVSGRACDAVLDAGKSPDRPNRGIGEPPNNKFLAVAPGSHLVEGH